MNRETSMRCWSFVLCVAIALCLQSAARADEYRLHIGDTLDFSVAGVSLQRTATVDTDGRVSLPLVGPLDAKGKTLTEILTYLRRELPKKSLNLRTPEGRDQITIIDPQEISLSIADYVPVYVNGDVSRPGEQKFRPGMTVRQSISLAGGYDVVRFRVENPMMANVDLEDELRTKWMDLEHAYARRDFLQKLLDRSKEATQPFALRSPLAKGLRDQAAKAETDQLRASLDAFNAERVAFERKITLLNDGLEALEKQKKNEDENAKLDNSEAARINDLFAKGTLPANRVADARRLALLSATRSLQVSSQLEADRRVRSDAQQALQKLISDRSEQVLKDLKETNDLISKTQSRIDALTEKLVYTSALRSQLLGSGVNSPQISVVRQVSGTAKSLSADADTPLEPGDVVEVKMTLTANGSSMAN
ncbi:MULTISPECIES: polysaccharide biosynthesis/export family protein [Methylobacterium]|uniref:polysaccharide biosynthesis/export family protein n=1 Tax=Methylobacterium TaxID=407 RepID=UPI0009E8FEFD|nr:MULTISPECIES: polysaccharide biosynthesis/export family protein [Methylobacterium]MCI9880441.1 polysaccharide biosynthesis/export family protein [Methylobacterium goesingense]